MKKIVLFISVFLGFIIQQTLSHTAYAKRVALIIGNNEYEQVAELQKAVNDAKAVAIALKEIGFEVMQFQNLKNRDMNRVIFRDFLSKLNKDDEALFYFAGHGIAVRGRNYLLATDIPKVKPGNERFITTEAFAVDEILAALEESESRVSILILDACRDNPFPKVGKRSLGSTRGLGRTDPPKGSFVMFSAGARQAALDRLNDDDPHPNSVYTRKLLPLLKTPGLTLTKMAKRLRSEVETLALTVKHDQYPAYYDQLKGEYLFVPGQVEIAEKNKPPSFSADEVLWKTIEASKKMSDFEFYLSKFPKGKFASAAENKISQLRASAEEKKVAVAITPDKVVAVVPDKKAVARSYKPGDTFKDCDECPEMVVVPPGGFMMGTLRSYLGSAIKNEWPRHKVIIPKKFAVGKFEVTFDEWKACLNGGGCKGYHPDDAGYGEENNPVMNVNWDDAKSFVSWLSDKTGKTYRLLSEAEWEYVARAKSDTPFWWGDTISTSQANYKDTGLHNEFGKYRRKTVLVDSFEANVFGLYNVHGNVSEWVEDCWHIDYYGAPKDQTAWLDDGDCSARVIRGGSWSSVPEDLRSAKRNWQNIGSRKTNIGFRVARTLD